MKCPYCGYKDTKVTDKRVSQGGTGIRRRRECLNSKCEKRFTTYEKIEQIERYVIKKDGRREPFNKDKIYLGIVKACEKRNIGHDKIDSIIADIEEKIQNQKEIPTNKLGEMVMKNLKKIDKVAYIRFASVYKDFEDVEDFKDLVREVK
ncbi:transcriptional regulator NrdR [Candidatus Pacearchaeota archaeon CG10_big_fil_rev_8_21_14_0_10_31_9]|nr:MAG: transcriptional regulator NrdR [Candidatus Pacearchaeota archaeon CG1_02_32_21]PIN94391.1 MAG: transcriptional regulator NrdR [Candidatus Pacearchaeota archaeon CG10_big_fil_rev_8_21_14_0_10_31_9]PIZ83002.1 MAG: transcriptional regulator NrdR [Candidatus Pacearchaeota archaeon CG_4_10_14_0_2_um_filter_05_32_18]